jgi:hypothetical protein
MMVYSSEIGHFIEPKGSYHSKTKDSNTIYIFHNENIPNNVFREISKLNKRFTFIRR